MFFYVGKRGLIEERTIFVIREDVDKDFMLQDKYTHFETLFKDNYSKLYFYVLNLINDAEQAEDIVEDVFAQVWKKFDTIAKEDRSLLSLLYDLARNSSMDYLRHCDVKGENADSAFRNNEVLTVMTEEDETERQERMKTVMHSIQTLPPHARKVFKACLLDGKGYKEVSDELGVSVNTVETYVIRSLSFIRKAVNSESESK